jgi:DNA-binding MarR family transcriptional regulator
MPPNNRSVIDERRQKLFALLSRGMKGYEIAKELGVDSATVSRDIKQLSAQSQSYLSNLAKETLPFMYQTSIEGIRDALKWRLRMTPEARYQREKRHYYWHDSYVEGSSEGCNPLYGGCIPECRFYPEYGRIEDEEVIENHNKLLEYHRQNNMLVEPPSESELLRLVKMHRFT